jgi:hypothetical protein
LVLADFFPEPVIFGQVGVHFGPMCEIESYGAVNLLEERVGNSSTRVSGEAPSRKGQITDSRETREPVR